MAKAVIFTLDDDLTRRAVSQAKRFGAEILSAHEASRGGVKDAYQFVKLNDQMELSCHTLFIATGTGSYHHPESFRSKNKRSFTQINPFKQPPQRKPTK